ncbi:MAG: hypothetical protein KF729_23530 [Sandaracinaceae bacterium]|nr:hypothetical protein [Sandaracinaceae bacterium]
MDVQLIAASVLDLPSSQRVDAIVHDGTTDLTLWRPPGADRDLLEQFGEELPTVLERERAQHPDGLALGELVRLHRGKLHCDFLVWVATRPPERDGVQADAPSAEVITRAVTDVLRFVSERHVARVAFGALGGGPKALPDADRLVLVARAANAFYDACYAEGRPTGIEEVLVCHPLASKIRDARRALGASVGIVEREAPPARAAEPAAPRRRSPAAPRAKAATGRKGSRAAPTLSADEIGHARATAPAYDRAVTYEPGQYVVHAKFGVGRVDALTPEGFILVLFESGETKRLLHGRP